MLIRELRDSDWPQTYSLFASIVAAGESSTFPEDLTSDEARALWTAPLPGHTVVAVEGDTVLGTARCGANRDGRGAHIGTASVMVDASASGRGVGQGLGEWVIDRLRTDGFRGIQFNAVVETNTVAVRLWQRPGFEIVGTVPGAFGSDAPGYTGLHVMYLDLTS